MLPCLAHLPKANWSANDISRKQIECRRLETAIVMNLLLCFVLQRPNPNRLESVRCTCLYSFLNNNINGDWLKTFQKFVKKKKKNRESTELNSLQMINIHTHTHTQLSSRVAYSHAHWIRDSHTYYVIFFLVIVAAINNSTHEDCHIHCHSIWMRQSSWVLT